MSEGAYLPSVPFDEYIRTVAAEHPRLHTLLDLDRARSTDILSALELLTNEFDSDETGRGDSYRRAQQDVYVRWTGAAQLLALATPGDADGDVTVLDVLGGDGTIARAVAGRAHSDVAKLNIVTGDISGRMVAQALEHGLPAVRQAAEALLLRDGSVDAALLAYGTHHIAPADRGRAAAEAVRVVRPGGRVVLHDFDETSPMARFFTEAVHTHSPTGHDYRHFSREELTDIFAGLPVSVRVVDVYDPLIVRGATAEDARDRMCDYVADMYGIRTYFSGQRTPAQAWDLLSDFFDHSAYLERLSSPPECPVRPVVREVDGGFAAEVPRVAIVALARKAV
ncbi:class I SAM-dependent methyltransferase [Streptomyces lavendulae]|uniref:Ubiquinone/menaquinone biosynthesis methyltransferase n=1 Tax=Streptomyces lavendulae subsp. lavendulae TaxID=58340 RepID=A0A2K8P8H5_STRLA|nr:methyltransferase domain-containing protein [Streptomyces lavendulae]ATZ22053.1 ubiquinone/menaquinone biosynthesis methyltransferase [Streptomyces lavendulae subsp. lavendulae]ATZ29518.1 ubiquinone/menaquinone biosynthesis methyltransferase [Streptomyces lavendulae subsp. lavendulae]